MRAKRKHYGGTDRETLQNVLRDHGFYSTEGRLQLLALLKQGARPMSVPEVTQLLGKHLVETNVYRALEALCAAGALTRSDVRRGGAHYEYAHSHHHHVVCSDCGRTEEIDLCVGRNLERRALRTVESFAEVKAHALEFFGTCKSCAIA